MTATIHWFRKDLRLADNAALTAAASGPGEVVPAYVHDDLVGAHRPGIAARAWLPRSLAALDTELRARGNVLTIRTGAPGEALVALAAECSATRVTCQRDHSPMALAEEAQVRAVLASRGIELVAERGQLLVEPDALATKQGAPYRVFTPYWRSWRMVWGDETSPAPASLRPPSRTPASAGPLAHQRGGPDLVRWWTAGEVPGRERLMEFAREGLERYVDDHDRPDLRGTSEMSIRLAWGEVSPGQVARAAISAGGVGTEPFLRQLAWREFSHHVLHHFPQAADSPLREEFNAFPWRDDPSVFDAWAHGQTGYPLIDAGMRQLLETGWMHNRVRMVCASFLTKDLLIPWQAGERFFAERLADYDPAVNVFNWQWVAGCGLDAAPYFRVFNPVVQGEKFDSGGWYVRTWVPELSGLASRWIHRPWEASSESLDKAGVRLGGTYPKRIVDHAQARLRALAAFESVKDARRSMRP